MAPKISEYSKSSTTGKNSPIKRDKSRYQALRLERLIRIYISLNTRINFKEFKHAITCRVILQPLKFNKK